MLVLLTILTQMLNIGERKVYFEYWYIEFSIEFITKQVLSIFCNIII